MPGNEAGGILGNEAGGGGVLGNEAREMPGNEAGGILGNEAGGGGGGGGLGMRLGKCLGMRPGESLEMRLLVSTVIFATPLYHMHLLRPATALACTGLVLHPLTSFTLLPPGVCRLTGEGSHRWAERKLMSLCEGQ